MLQVQWPEDQADLQRGSPRASTWRSSTSIRKGIRRGSISIFNQKSAGQNLTRPNRRPGGSCSHGHGQLYGVGSEIAHLRAESSWATAGLPPSCLDVDYRLKQQPKNVASKNTSGYRTAIGTKHQCSNLYSDSMGISTSPMWEAIPCVHQVLASSLQDRGVTMIYILRLGIRQFREDCVGEGFYLFGTKKRLWGWRI
ncbi:hypothetical protein M9H77_25955 [Catharanthus roseus]|uniref:Uncharacterized protein n=1 Tax=Catharanthus roseus TaxID=4058 RepID=A0ACC0A8B6_CATRO|nr:hypothetical protein M9H77_25955 [Catharanthus roseus]